MGDVPAVAAVFGARDDVETPGRKREIHPRVDAMSSEGIDVDLRSIGSEHFAALSHDERALLDRRHPERRPVRLGDRTKVDRRRRAPAFATIVGVAKEQSHAHIGCVAARRRRRARYPARAPLRRIDIGIVGRRLNDALPHVEDTHHRSPVGTDDAGAGHHLVRPDSAGRIGVEEVARDGDDAVCAAAARLGRGRSLEREHTGRLASVGAIRCLRETTLLPHAVEALAEEDSGPCTVIVRRGDERPPSGALRHSRGGRDGNRRRLDEERHHVSSADDAEALDAERS